MGFDQSSAGPERVWSSVGAVVVQVTKLVYYHIAADGRCRCAARLVLRCCTAAASTKGLVRQMLCSAPTREEV